MESSIQAMPVSSDSPQDRRDFYRIGFISFFVIFNVREKSKLCQLIQLCQSRKSMISWIVITVSWM